MNQIALEKTDQLASSAEAEFESFFGQHYERVYAMVFRLVRNRIEAEDWTIEAFWRLWTRLSQPIENKTGWLYRVAVRLAYNALRSSKRRIRYEQQAGLLQLSTDSTRDIHSQLERSQDRDRVRDVLRRLSRRHAEILMLRHSGLSYKEIASALKVSPGSVGTLLLRAEKEFERIYKQGAAYAS